MIVDKAAKEGTLDERLQDISKAKSIILDELGYVPSTVDGTRALSQVISVCYERRSLSITTTIEFSK